MPGNGFRLDPDFRKLWIGQTISQIGSNITGVGLPLTVVLVLKASPLHMGFLSGAGAAAVVISALAYCARERPYWKQPAGLDRVDCADRWPQRRRHPGPTDHGAHGHAVRR